jgi:hypothetical protein
MTDFKFADYPNIKRAGLELSYCNGGINRERAEDEALAGMETGLADGAPINWTPVDYKAMDMVLSTFTDEELNMLCDGEDVDQQVLLLKRAPDKQIATNVEDLLNLLFMFC